MIAAAGAMPVFGAAQSMSDWPQRPLKLIVPQSPSSSADVIARLLAKELPVELNQPVIVENKAGAAGNIGAEYVANSAPDGYTLLYGFNSVATINPNLYAKLPFSFRNDLAPVTQTTVGGYILVTNNNVPARSLRELVDYVKKNPGAVTFGSDGIGSMAHLCAELLAERTGMQILHVPYKGTPTADLLAGHIQAMFAPVTVLQELVRAGQMRGLVTTKPKRLQALPQMPTLAELLPGLSLTGWQGIWVAKSTPAVVIERLQSAVARALVAPEVLAKLNVVELQPVGSTPKELGELVDRETAQWAPIIKKLNLRAD